MHPGNSSRARRACCGVCRMTTLVRTAGGPRWVPSAERLELGVPVYRTDGTTGWRCDSCKIPWDGSYVDRNQLPELMEQTIAAGVCTRAEAFETFLRLDDLAEAAAKTEITVGQGAELVALDAYRVLGKARPQ
jgi:hypothetical protein